MPDRRNPYLILGLDFGASPQQAQAAFARLSRRLRRETGAPYRIEDATWALHEIEHAATDPDVNLAVYRVPANPDAYTYQPADGILTAAPQNLPRRSSSSEPAVTWLQASVADQVGAAAMAAAVDAWETTGRAEVAGGASSAEPAAAAVDGPGPAPEAGAPAPVGAGAAGRRDPFAVALGNATLFGVGYLLLRRGGAAVLAIATTLVLFLILAGFGQPGWFWRVVLLLWWVTTIGHGWRLARRQEPEPAAPRRMPVGRQRGIAVAAALAVLVVSIGIAVDARRVGAAAADAHQAGDCGTATETLAGIGRRHRVVDPFVTRRTSGDAEACALLLGAYAVAEDDPAAAADQVQQYLDHRSARWEGASGVRADLLLAAAEAELATALDGTVASLTAGFDLLAEVLAVTPDRAEGVSGVLAGYVSQLPTVDPCHAKLNIDWLFEREASGDVLDQAAEDADGSAPAVFLACGDLRLEGEPAQAISAYEALLDGYPDHELASDARQGVEAAETSIEEEQVGQLIRSSGYCADPARYRGAPAYTGAGPHPVLTFGSDQFSEAVPSEWLAEDHTDAVLVLCATGPEAGSVIQTCFYEGDALNPGAIEVALRTNRYTVEAFELHTGERAFETTVDTGSGGCPPFLQWQCGAFEPNCPPPNSIRATHSDGPLRSAVESWVFP